MPSKAPQFNVNGPLGDAHDTGTPSITSSPLRPPSSATSSSSVAKFSSAPLSDLSPYTRQRQAEKEAQEAEKVVAMDMASVTLEVQLQGRSRQQQSLIQEEGQEDNEREMNVQLLPDVDIIEDHSESFNASLTEALTSMKLVNAEEEKELGHEDVKEEKGERRQ